MNTPCHCSRDSTLRAMKNGVGWILPGVMLALLPKCPLCLAAWLSLLLGFGLSATTASVLHTALIFFCVVTFSLFLIRQLTSSLRKPHH